MIGITGFEVLILGAMAVASLAPLILIGLFVRDWKRGDLW